MAKGSASRRWRASTPIRRAEAGSAIVEFALIAPVFLFLLFVIAETGLVFIAEEVQENGVAKAARIVRTGEAQSAQLEDKDFKGIVCEYVSLLIDCDSPDFHLDVRAYEDMSGMDLEDPLDAGDTLRPGGAYQFGGPNDIVVVRAYYQWNTNPIYGGLSLQNLKNGKRLISAFAAFRNEPFPAAAASSE